MDEQQITEMETLYRENTVPLPLWLSRHQIHIPKAGEPDAEIDGLGHPGLWFEPPVVEGIPVERLSGVNVTFHPLPGDGNYEMLVALSFEPEEFTEIRRRQTAALKVAELKRIEAEYDEDDRGFYEGTD